MASGDVKSLPYTSDQTRLAIKDIGLFLKITVVWPITAGLPSIILPFYPFKSGALDELYPNAPNLWAIFLHIILLVFQLGFVLALIPSLLFGLPLPFLGWTPTCILSIFFVVVGNKAFTILLNGSKREFNSFVDPNWEVHENEKWIFVNGVAVGGHWMQSNLDRLAATFQRPVHGIHNLTRGIIFDVLEVIVQRTFGYATADVREVYAEILKCVTAKRDDGKPRWKKIVLILHSQGGVEGGLVLDWLYATVGQELMQCVEVYTFGNAANHFNSPRTVQGDRVVKHIEHYANLKDWVSLFGILNFRPWKPAQESPQEIKELRNRYVGRLFIRDQSGHQMNGNYLDNFFEMSIDSKGHLVKVEEDNEYMSAILDENLLERYNVVGTSMKRRTKMANGQTTASLRQIKDVSRLWLYRNGLSPPNDEQ